MHVSSQSWGVGNTRIFTFMSKNILHLKKNQNKPNLLQAYNVSTWEAEGELLKVPSWLELYSKNHNKTRLFHLNKSEASFSLLNKCQESISYLAQCEHCT